MPRGPIEHKSHVLYRQHAVAQLHWASRLSVTGAQTLAFRPSRVLGFLPASWPRLRRVHVSDALRRVIFSDLHVSCNYASKDRA